MPLNIGKQELCVPWFVIFLVKDVPNVRWPAWAFASLDELKKCIQKWLGIARNKIFNDQIYRFFQYFSASGFFHIPTLISVCETECSELSFATMLNRHTRLAVITAPSLQTLHRLIHSIRLLRRHPVPQETCQWLPCKSPIAIAKSESTNIFVHWTMSLTRYPAQFLCR